MDADRFDTLARSLTLAGTRRWAMLALSGALGLALGASTRDEAEAKKKKKKRKRKKTSPSPTVPPLPCGGCPSGQTCLSNGSCAIPCPTGDGECPFNRCASCDRNAEQMQYCSDGLTAPCTAYQICTLPTGTSGCPKGSQCQPCVGSPEYRCIPLCTG